MATKNLMQIKTFATVPHYDLNPEKRLYFYQKYTDYEIKQKRKSGAQGYMNANAQGTGKTLTTLIGIQGEGAVILAPNPVVSAWPENEGEFFLTSSLSVLEGPHRERIKRLKSLERLHVVTNVEFSQGMTLERRNLLSRPDGVLVVDEADYLGNRGSQQSLGTRQIQSGFTLLLSATPFKRTSQIGNILSILYPGDKRFQSPKAFARAFPMGDPVARNSLFVLLDNHMIRIRKEDVFETYDPKIPLEEQQDKLPAKVEVSPEELGQFELTPEQTRSIHLLFTDYQRWCGLHKGKESEEDQGYYRYQEGFFSKREALRQIMNDPAYIGRADIDSPKHKMMDRIVEKELAGAANQGRKMVIFVRYKDQVREYMKRYRDYGVRAYYGDLPQNSMGYRVDRKMKVLYYKVDEHDNYELDAQGKPIEVPKGEGHPIRSLDYERILFQNDPDSRILVSTYDVGSMGVTFTAADVLVSDDLAPTYKDQFQADDRIHRIDNLRKKYRVKYYRLQALYPEKVLEKLSPKHREDYFDVGTYDQVHYENLKRQGKIFHRIMDGVGDESEFSRLSEGMFGERMPFLFNKGEGGDREELISNKDEEDSGTPSISATYFKGRFSWVKNLPVRVVGVVAIPMQELSHIILARVLGLPVSFELGSLWGAVNVDYGRAPPWKASVVRLGGLLANLVFGLIVFYVVGFHGFDAPSVLSFQTFTDLFVLSNLLLFVSDTILSLITKRGDFWLGAVTPLQSNLKKLLNLRERLEKANLNKDLSARVELINEIIADGDKLLGSIEDIDGTGSILVQRLAREVESVPVAKSYADVTGLSQGSVTISHVARGLVETAASRTSISLEEALDFTGSSLVLMDSLESVNWQRVESLLKSKGHGDVLVVTPSVTVAERLEDLGIPVVLQEQDVNAFGLYQMNAPVLRENPILKDFINNSSGLNIFHTSLIYLDGLDQLSPADPLRMAGELARLIDQALQLRKPPTSKDWHNIFKVLEAISKFA